MSVIVENISETNPSNSLKLHTVLVEIEHTFDTAPGTNGQTHFEYSIIDHLDSRSVSFPDGAKLVTYSFDYPDSIISIDNRTPSKLALISFIQDDATKQVLQSIYKEVSN